MHQASSFALFGWQSMGASMRPPAAAPGAARLAAAGAGGVAMEADAAVGAAADGADMAARRDDVRGDARVEDPDRTLVADAVAGDRGAFEALVLRHQTRIVNYALAIVRDPADAEDVAQETFIRAYRSLARFRGDSSFKTWLYTIATNAARTGLDRRGRRSRVEDGSLDDEAGPLAAADVPAGTPTPRRPWCGARPSTARWPPCRRTCGSRWSCATSRGSTTRRSRPRRGRPSGPSSPASSAPAAGSGRCCSR